MALKHPNGSLDCNVRLVLCFCFLPSCIHARVYMTKRVNGCDGRLAPIVNPDIQDRLFAVAAMQAQKYPSKDIIRINALDAAANICEHMPHERLKLQGRLLGTMMTGATQ